MVLSYIIKTDSCSKQCNVVWYLLWQTDHLSVWTTVHECKKHQKKAYNELLSDYFLPSHAGCTGEGETLRQCVIPKPSSCHNYLLTVHQAFRAIKPFLFEIIRMTKYRVWNQLNTVKCTKPQYNWIIAVRSQTVIKQSTKTSGEADTTLIKYLNFS